MKIVLRRGMVAALVVSMLGGCTFAAPIATPQPTDGPTASQATDDPVADRTPRPETTPDTTPEPTRRPRRTPSPEPTQEPTPAPTELADIPGLDSLLGSDGRFTVLLLGSDARDDSRRGRTDTIMLASIDPTNGRVAMASLPRDTVRVPIGPGDTYGSGFVRINGLFQQLIANTGSKKKALRQMVRAMEYMSGVEIDRYALIGFPGVRNLVDSIKGVEVTLDRPLVDLSLHVVHKGRRGLRLKEGRNRLTGGLALAYARTRHTDTDYARAERQQVLIMAAVNKVLKRGAEGLPELAAKVMDHVDTDIDLGDAPALFALAERAKTGAFKSFVLGPSKWAGQGDQQYNTQLRIDTVRRMFRQQFGPVEP